MTSYESKKQRVQAQLKSFSGGAITLNKDTSNLFRDSDNAEQILDVKDFNQIIRLDPDNKTVEVEAMITYEQLVIATLKQGFVPPVAPELKSITIGGAISGIGVESSSFKYGFVHETVLEMDVLTGAGEVVTCSPVNNSDLFYAIPNSYGTLGYVLRVVIQLVPAKPYVKISKQKFTDYTSYVEAIKQHSIESREQGTYDFIDGLVFKPHDMHLMLGRFVDQVPFKSDYTYMGIFYKSMNKQEDYLTTFDYIFRYDTDWFWTTKSIGLENPILRALMGRQRLRSDVYYKMMKWERKHQIMTRLNGLIKRPRTEKFIHDAEVRADQAAEFLAWFHQNITDAQPLTIGAVMPYKKSVHYTLFPMDPDEIYFNIGYYGRVVTNQEEWYYNKLFEQKLIKLGAKKMMYSDSFYSEDEFWKIFNKKAYDELKAKYDPQSVFKNLYQQLVRGGT